MSKQQGMSKAPASARQVRPSSRGVGSVLQKPEIEQALPDVQLPAIVEIGIVGKAAGNAYLFTKVGEALAQILIRDRAEDGPAGWVARASTQISPDQPVVLTPDAIVAVGIQAYCRIDAGWGSDPKKSPLALVEGVRAQAQKRPDWIPANDWQGWSPDVVRVIHPLCPPVLHTRKHIVDGGAVVEELFTSSSVVQILR